MAALKDIVVDCRHPASVARFWAEILDGYQVAPYDEEELARLRANGINDPEDDPTVLVERADGGRPRLFFQLVPEPKVVKNRVHLDLTAGDLPAEVAGSSGSARGCWPSTRTTSCWPTRKATSSASSSADR